MNLRSIIVIGVCCAAMSVGCSTTTQTVTKDNFEAAKKRSSLLMKERTNIEKENERVTRNDNTVALGKPFKVHERPVLPSFFEAKFAYSQKEPLPINAVFDEIAQKSFKLIEVTSDAREAMKESGGQSGQQEQQVQSDSVSNLSTLTDSSNREIKKISVPPFNGKFKDLLDYVTAKSGLFWRWDGRKIVVFRNQRKMFIVDAQAFARDTGSTVTTSSSSSAQGGEGGANASVNSSLNSRTEGSWNFWPSLEAQIDSMLTSTGSYSANPALGTVVVVDTPTAISHVENFIADTNELAGKMIALKVEIYQVQTSGEFNFGIDWDIAFNDGVSNVGLNTNNIFTNGAGQLGSTLIDPGSKFSNSKFLLRALDKQGNVSKVNNFNVSVMNGEISPLQDAFETNYLKSSSTTVTQETVTSELEPGTVISGLTLDVRPQITSDGKILVYSAFNLATLQTIETLQNSTGDTQIQLPQRKLRTLYNNAKVQSGGTILVTGFKEMITDHSQQGLGHNEAYFLGGNRSDEYNSSELVILITPYIMQG